MSNGNSKFVSGLLGAWHIVEFGVICCICCIPVITAGAATTAMFRMFFDMREGKPVSFTRYFDVFGDRFKNATYIELVQLGSGIIIGLMAYITLKASSISSAGMLLLAPVSLLMLIWLLVFAYAYAHEAYFGMDMAMTIKSCFTMTFGCLLYTTALLLLLMILPMLYFLSPDMFIVMLPVWIVLLIPLINWWDSYFYIKAFESLMQETGDEAGAGMTEEAKEETKEETKEELTESDS